MGWELFFAHILGDYFIQSNKMAQLKTKSSLWCFIHVLCYGIPFTFIPDMSLLALFIIISTHFVIDRFSLAKYIIWCKNRIWEEQDFEGCMKNFGYSPSTPTWLAFFLYVVVDNTMHLIINYYAYLYL